MHQRIVVPNKPRKGFATSNASQTSFKGHELYLLSVCYDLHLHIPEIQTKHMVYLPSGKYSTHWPHAYQMPFSQLMYGFTQLKFSLFLCGQLSQLLCQPLPLPFPQLSPQLLFSHSRLVVAFRDMAGNLHGPTP